MSIQAVILLLCVCALVAFFINRKKKLPKSVFLFFSVAIIVSVSFYALDIGGDDDETVDGNGVVPGKTVIFFPAASDISVPPGETRFALPVAVSGERIYDCIRFVLKSEDALITEQSFLDKVRFSLLFSDGSLIPASSIVFSRENDEMAFPKLFVLKVFFVYPASVDGTEIRCVVENGLNSGLRAAEISVGSLPASHSDD